jgi:putative YphP/YqiW family bacilliredoxin
MPYPEFFVAPMRAELVDLGFEELRTPQAVDDVVASTKGTLLLVVNSVCGCAAGKARPGIALALRNGARPDRLTAVFAGFDTDATDRARDYFTGVRPSSPSIALMQDGKLVYMMERHQIESRGAMEIAADLQAAFSKYCQPAVTH